MNVEDELCPRFIKQKGGSINICLGNSAIGHGLCIQPYDECENEMSGASVFIQSKRRVTEIRDLLNEILDSGQLIDDIDNPDSC